MCNYKFAHLYFVSSSVYYFCDSTTHIHIYTCTIYFMYMYISLIFKSQNTLSLPPSLSLTPSLPLSLPPSPPLSLSPPSLPRLDRLRMTYVLPVRPTRKLASLAIIIINPRRACARGLQYLSCLCVCVFSLFWHLAQSGVQTAVSATSARYGHEI